MLDLAENETGSYIPLKDIAARQDVSKKYLEIIVKDMVAGGLITGASGPAWRLIQMTARESLHAGHCRCGQSMTTWCMSFFTAKS